MIFVERSFPGAGSGVKIAGQAPAAEATPPAATAKEEATEPAAAAKDDDYDDDDDDDDDDEVRLLLQSPRFRWWSAVVCPHLTQCLGQSSSPTGSENRVITRNRRNVCAPIMAERLPRRLLLS